MKKINFEKLTNKDLFSKFSTNKIDTLASSSIRGGDDPTSTALCKTSEKSSDQDSQADKESLADPRCTGY